MTRSPRSTADWVSLALNPSLLTGVFFVVLAWRFEPTPGARIEVAVLAAAFATLVPIAALFGLVATGRLSDVEMRVRQERDVVFRVCLVSYFLGALTLWAIGASWPVWGFMALHVPNTILLSLLNRWWKVSIHTTVIAGVAAAALMLLGREAAPVLLLLPLAAWGRWRAGAHSPLELTAGALYGSGAVALGLALLGRVVGG